MLPPPPYNNILFELDFNVKFLLLRLLQFLNDLKSTINSAPINVITVVRMFLQEIVCKILMVGCHYRTTTRTFFGRSHTLI